MYLVKRKKKEEKEKKKKVGNLEGAYEVVHNEAWEFKL